MFVKHGPIRENKFPGATPPQEGILKQFSGMLQFAASFELICTILCKNLNLQNDLLCSDSVDRSAASTITASVRLEHRIIDACTETCIIFCIFSLFLQFSEFSRFASVPREEMGDGGNVYRTF